MYNIDYTTALEILYKKLEEFILKLKDIEDAETEEYTDDYMHRMIFDNSKEDKFKLNLKINVINQRINDLKRLRGKVKNWDTFLMAANKHLNEIDEKNYNLM